MRLRNDYHINKLSQFLYINSQSLYMYIYVNVDESLDVLIGTIKSAAFSLQNVMKGYQYKKINLIGGNMSVLRLNI